MAEEIDVVVPTIGESISEAAIGRWLVKDGDAVQKDQAILELDSDKASMEVTAESAGKISLLAKEGDVVAIGAKVASIHTGASGKNSSSEKEAASSSNTSSKPSSKKVVQVVRKEEDDGESTDISTEASREPLQAVASAGASGAQDAQIKTFPPSQRKAIRHGKVELLDSKSGQAKNPFAESTAGETRTPMTNLRKTIANRLLHSQHSTATLTTFNEVDMTKSMAVRSKVKDEFLKKHGVKLGFMSFFSKAVVEALKEFPLVNSYLDEDEIVNKSGVHLGIAVSTDRGLVVPVIKSVDQMNYAEIESAILAVAEKARDGKLSIQEMQGGTFTITNGGVFGSLLSTPILNPPQSGILGMHKIEHRPIAVKKADGYSVEVRPMMYIALSYDHRLIDGATSVGFLVKVKEYLENVSESDLGF